MKNSAVWQANIRFQYGLHHDKVEVQWKMIFLMQTKLHHLMEKIDNQKFVGN